jgi:hypothetical protein
MSDVVASVTAVLSQTSLQTSLQGAMPAVLQKHMQAVAAEARQQLLPAPDGDRAGGTHECDDAAHSMQVGGTQSGCGHIASLCQTVVGMRNWYIDATNLAAALVPAGVTH